MDGCSPAIRRVTARSFAEFTLSAVERAEGDILLILTVFDADQDNRISK